MKRLALEAHNVAARRQQNGVSGRDIPFAHIAEARLEIGGAFGDAAEFDR